MAEQVSGQRVYVTFIKDGTIAIHPSNCKSERYKMRDEGSVHVSKNTSDEELGKLIRKVRNDCKT